MLPRQIRRVSQPALAGLAALFWLAAANAQQPADAPLQVQQPAAQPADQQPAAPARQPAPGPFAPGVLTIIPPDMQPDETVSTHELIELRTDPTLRWSPELLSASRTLFAKSEEVKFRRDVWCLEFSFKPMRMIEVDIPQPSGRMQRKLIWYIVYRVRNTGQVLRPVEQPEAGQFTAELAPGGQVRFIPHFLLVSHDRDAATGDRVNKAYLDRVIPAAVEPIRLREMRGQPLLNSVEMAEQPVPPSDDRVDRGVWGVATWEEIDPRIDFFSLLVGGLTNAYRWEDEPGVFQPGDPPGRGRRFERKELQLNFWRPGDELLENEREIRFGLPIGMAGLYDVPAGVAHRWVYR
jgi:hypothetical protein